MQSRSRWDFFDMQMGVQTKVGEIKVLLLFFLLKRRNFVCHDTLLEEKKKWK